MTKKRGLLLAVAVVILAQFAVPTIALMQDKPARFGFQMYSGYGAGSITVLDDTGAEIQTDLAALLPRNLRPELDWAAHVPRHFCAEIPDAATVVIERDNTGRESVPCD